MTETDDSPIIVAGPLDGAPGEARQRRWHYLPALDGVRAVAVIAVVLFHFWPDAFPGGFVGVDVFFAMSGLLITGILMNEHGTTGRIDLGAFWGRRVRRLVPAVVVLVVVTAVATWATGTDSARQLADSIGALTWTTNLVEAVFGGTRVWLHNSDTTIDHLWSLAIEEQFYLVWPLVAVLLFRRVRSTRARVAVVLGLVALSALSMGLVGGIHAYFRTDTRAFELLAGAALALSGWVLGRRPAWMSTVLGIGGLVGLGLFVAFVGPNDEWMYPWGFLLVSLCSVMLVAAASQPPPWMSAVLGSRPLRHLGQVSYGVYLWHIPVQRLLSPGRMGFGGIGLTVVRFAVLAVIVEASFRFVEEPFRKQRLSLRWPQFAGGYLVAGLAILLLVPATARDLDGQWDPIDGPPRNVADRRKVLVVGDLYGAALASRLRDDDSSSAVWSVAEPGCPGLLGSGLAPDAIFDDGGSDLEIGDPAYCDHWRERWTRAVERFDPDLVVLASGYWDTLPIRQNGDPVNRPALDSVYRKLVALQVRSLLDAGVERQDVIIVSLARWTDVVAPSQRSALDDRGDSLGAYDEAVAAAVETFEIGTLEVAQADDPFEQISSAPR